MRHRQKRMPSYFELVMNCLLALLIIFAGAKTRGHHVRLCRQCSVEVEATIKEVWTSKASDKDFPEKYINIYIPVYTYSFEGEEYDSPSNWIYSYLVSGLSISMPNATMFPLDASFLASNMLFLYPVPDISWSDATTKIISD